MIKKKNRGFTLMEMLIVVAIIAVLVAVAIPVLNNNLEKARQAVDMANARAIQAILATLVNTGEVVFPEKTNDTYAEGIGIVGFPGENQRYLCRRDWYLGAGSA